jgi:hypothetical protein
MQTSQSRKNSTKTHIVGLKFLDGKFAIIRNPQSTDDALLCNLEERVEQGHKNIVASALLPGEEYPKLKRALQATTLDAAIEEFRLWMQMIYDRDQFAM